MTPRSAAKPLATLFRDTAGNTLAIMAMAMFPLAGLVGGGLDMSRLYLAKSRLQQACDAGALAGRKVMGASTWAANGGAAGTAALQFFDGNFEEGSYGTGVRTRAFTETAGKISGTAAVVVPMTIMRIFGSTEQTISVVCDAELRLPNTDIMFVLDTTGSMTQTLPGDTATKIDTLKKATKCFYETVARLDTNADCGSGDPSGGTDPQTRIRFGFVPYSSNVNVGKLLPTSYFANSWQYQSRGPLKVARTTYSYNSPNGTPTVTATSQEDLSPNNNDTNTYQVVSQSTKASDAACQSSKPSDNTAVSTGAESAAPAYSPSSGSTSPTRTDTWQTRQPYKQQYQYRAAYLSGQCYIGRRVLTFTLVRTYSRQDTGTPVTVQVFDRWKYAARSFDISGLKNGTAWNNSVSLPEIGDTDIGSPTVADRMVDWDGCIEERRTTQKTDYSALSASEKVQARDLDIDTVPTQGDASTLWAPALRTAIYNRNSAEETSTSNFSQPYVGFPYVCPRESRLLQSWPTATPFQNYVDSLTTDGMTHHDIGLLWGARFLSAQGIFSATNADTAERKTERHMIFMTDGETCTNTQQYNAYGLVKWDNRQLPAGTTQTALGDSSASNICKVGTLGTLEQQINARFEAMCTAVKNKNITLWVVYFGTTDTATTDRMTKCATPGRFKPAANSSTLIEAFKSIATQISQLRLTT